MENDDGCPVLGGPVDVERRGRLRGIRESAGLIRAAVKRSTLRGAGGVNGPLMARVAVLLERFAEDVEAGRTE